MLTNELVAREIQVSCLASEGLGFGHGKIGVDSRLNNPEDPLSEDILKSVLESLSNPDMLVDIDIDPKTGIKVDDDGCGDGREVGRVMIDGQEKSRSLIRPKVFGAAPVMVLASSVGLGEMGGVSPQDLFAKSVFTLKDREIGFGGHSDRHATAPDCGCGAIDKMPEIISAVVQYQDNIRGVVKSLGFGDDGLDSVLSSYKGYYQQQIKEKSPSYSGVTALGEVIDSGKVVKELDGSHNEVAIVLNTVNGKTVDQQKVREITNGTAQVFAVDLWRMQEIADRLHPESKEDSKKSFVSMLVYSLGVAATLTGGDLPVYLAEDKLDLTNNQSNH